MRISTSPMISSINVFQSESNPSANLGQKVLTQDGREFRYAKVGGSTLVVGNLLQAPVADTQFKDMAVPAAVDAGTAAGSAVTITNGTTAVVAGDFSGGILVVSVTPGLGEMYLINGNGAAANGAALTLYLDETIRTAWTTSTKVSIIPSPYNGVIQQPGTASGTMLGGAVLAATTGKYCWIQVGGMGAALSDATASSLPIQDLSASTGTAGAVTKQITLTTNVATALQYITVSGKVEPVIWNIR